jgi:hypothetical protein
MTQICFALCSCCPYNYFTCCINYTSIYPADAIFILGRKSEGPIRFFIFFLGVTLELLGLQPFWPGFLVLFQDPHKPRHSGRESRAPRVPSAPRSSFLWRSSSPMKVAEEKLTTSGRGSKGMFGRPSAYAPGQKHLPVGKLGHQGRFSTHALLAGDASLPYGILGHQGVLNPEN